METINGTTFVANTSSSTNTCDSSLVDSVTVKVIETAAYSVLLLFSLVGNSLVPAIVYRNPLLHTSVNYFIASMSISDLLIPIFAYPETNKLFSCGILRMEDRRMVWLTAVQVERFRQRHFRHSDCFNPDDRII